MDDGDRGVCEPSEAQDDRDERPAEVDGDAAAGGGGGATGDAGTSEDDEDGAAEDRLHPEDAAGDRVWLRRLNDERLRAGPSWEERPSVAMSCAAAADDDDEPTEDRA